MNNLRPAHSALITVVRPGLRRHYLTASLGLMCTLVPSSASANSGTQHAGSFAGTPNLPHSTGRSSLSNPWTSYAVHNSPGLPAVGHKNLLQQTKVSNFNLSNTPDALNLGSSQSNFSLSGLGSIQTLTITVGGKSEVVDLSTKLTGAELLAADQVLSGAHQTLTINASGAATGGAFTLSSQSLSAIDQSLGGLNALSVPRNVHMVDTLTSLQLTGDLINSGHIVTQPITGNTSTIQAENIINTAGASIASAGQGSKGNNLALIANNQLLNNGTISAANNLTITTPAVVNSGTLKATAGNLNFSSATSATINNTNGTISATQGNINVSTSSANGNVDITGGDLLSNQLNINAGTGTVNVNAGNITGVVNVDACSAHITAATADLQLGALNVTGDPTYYNQGNITITSAMAPTNGQDLAIIASGNVLSNGGSLNTSSSSIIGSGGSIILIAGANFTTSDSSTAGSNNSTTTLTMTYGPGSGNGSISGGLIDLSGGNGGKAPITSISTAGGGIGNAGSVTMYAFAGKGANSGTVTLPKTFTLDAGTGGAGSSGDVRINAGALKGTAISVGNITTSRGSTGQGDIELDTGRPALTTPVTILNGAITGGSLSGGLIPNSAAVVAGNLTTGGGNVFITTKGTITFGTIDVSGRGGFSIAGADGTAGGNAGAVFLTGFGNISGNNIFANGGGGGGGSVNGNNGTNGGNGGFSNPITITASGGSITIKGMIDASGGGGGGGGGTGYNGAAGSAGNGGMPGTGADVQLTSLKAPVVMGGIFAADGNFGGGGGLVVGTSAGSGGGGGGSYGGGGGGGAGGIDLGIGGAGGGGGGGLYGGGGGSGASFTGVANLGGSGGGLQIPGAGGAGTSQLSNGAAGSKLAGGNGAAVDFSLPSGVGGSLGFGGLGGAFGGGPGSNGTNVIVAGAITGGNLTINTGSGSTGTLKAPLTTLVQNLQVGLSGFTPGSQAYYINNGAGVTTTITSFGTVSITAAGDINVIGPSNSALNLLLTTTTASNGNININSSTNAETAVLNAGGTGAIEMATGKLLLANTTTLTANSIGTLANPINIGGFRGTTTINSVNSVFVIAPFNLTLEKSSSSAGDLNITAKELLTVAGTVSAPGGTVYLTGTTGLVVASNISAGASVNLITKGTGDITEKNTILSPGASTALILNIDGGTIGTANTPFKTSAGTVTVVGNAVTNHTSSYITDTNTGVTVVQAMGNAGFQFNVTSSASQLQLAGGAYPNETISNISKTGSILLTGATGGGNDVSITTVGGNVTESTGSIDAFTLILKSGTGSFGISGSPIDIKAHTLTFNTGKSAVVNLVNTTPLIVGLTGLVNASTAGTVTLNDLQTTLVGPIKASSVTITDSGPVMTQEAGAIITANSVTLTNTTGNITSNAAIKASAVKLDTSTGLGILYSQKIGNGLGAIKMDGGGGVTQTGTAGLLSGTTVSLNAVVSGTSIQSLDVATPSLTFASTGSTYVNVVGNTTLQTSGAGVNLTLTSLGTMAVGAGQTVSATANASITAKTFSLPSNASLTATNQNLTISTTGSGTAINLLGDATGGNRITLLTTPAAEVSVGSNSTVFAPQITIQTATLDNSGVIKTTAAGPNGILTISNPTSNLLITNTGTIGTPVIFTVMAGGNLTIQDSGGGIAPLQTMTANSITLTAKGALTLPNLPNGLLAAQDASHDGGMITISAGSIIYPSGGLFLDADALFSSMGNGGIVSVTITGKQNLTFANSPGWFITADAGMNGGTGGNISVSTGGAIFVNEADGAISNGAFASGNTGGATTLSAGSNLSIVGVIDTSQQIAGVIPGAVTLNANGKTPFLIDQNVTMTSSTNGINDLVGSVVKITNLAGVNLDANSTLTANTSLTVTASEFTQNGQLPGSAAIITVTNPGGNLTIGGSIANTNGVWPALFDLVLTSGGNLNTGNLFNTVPIHSVIVDVTAKGMLTLGANSIATGSFLGGGGLLEVTAAKLVYPGQSSGPITLDASGSASNTFGGQVDLTLTGTTATTVSNAGAGNVNVIVVAPTNNGATSGGTVDINTGGNLTVNLSGLQTFGASPGIDSTVTLQSGASLLVNAWNANVIGAGGTLVTSEKSSTPFIIGAAIKSGIVTAVTTQAIEGQSISITNNGGDVQINGSGADNLFSPSPTGQITVVADKNIVGVPGVESIFADTVNLTSSAGSIGLTAKGMTPNPLSIFTQNLSANAAKGNVSIDQNFSATALTVDASSALAFNLTTAASVLVAGAITAPSVSLTTLNNGAITLINSIGSGLGPVTLTAGQGNITQSQGTTNATTLSLVSATNVTLQTNITGLSTGSQVSGNIVVNNVGSKLLMLGPVLQAGSGNITVTSAGAITQSGTAFSSNVLTYNAGGAIIIDGNITGATVALNASNGGTVTEGKGVIVAASSTLILTSDSGDINSAKGSFLAPNLVIGTSGNVIVADTLSTLSGGNINVATITLPVKSFSLNATSANTSTLFLNNISTSSGSISVVYNGGSLSTMPGVQLSTNNGSITLQNTLSTGDLSLSTGATLHASATASGLGDVNLFVGPAPKTPAVGMQPANIQENFTGKGQIFYNNDSAISTTANPTTLNAFGRNINISAPGPGFGIFLDGNTITADPPPAGASAPAASAVAATLPSVISLGAPTALSVAAITGLPSGAPISTPTITFVPVSQTAWSQLTTNPSLMQNIGQSLNLGQNPGFGISSCASGEAIDCAQTWTSSSVENTVLGKQSNIFFAQQQDSRGNISKVLGDEALLIAPDTDTAIQTKFGTVELKSKCLALLVSTEKGLTIFNLDDSRQGSVVARVGQDSITLAPGRHLTISGSNASDFAQINPVQMVAHRRMTAGHIGNFKSFTSEFHLVSAISTLKQLREFMTSVEPAKQQTAKHLLKTAAILDGFSQGSSEPFELYSENLVTAMNR